MNPKNLRRLCYLNSSSGYNHLFFRCSTHCIRCSTHCNYSHYLVGFTNHVGLYPDYTEATENTFNTLYIMIFIKVFNSDNPHCIAHAVKVMLESGIMLLHQRCSTPWQLPHYCFAFQRTL